MSDILEGAPASQVSALWSIANSIEAAFPNAAETLRSIAVDLRDTAPSDSLPGVRRHCGECGTSWNALSVRVCPTCEYLNVDPLASLAGVPDALEEL